MVVDPSNIITVVSGLPRSGTSLMMQALVGGGLTALTDDQRPADDSNARGYFEYTSVASVRSDASWITAARGHVVKVVVPLVTALPLTERYRVVVMRRSFDRMIDSQRAMLDRLNRAGAALPSEQLARVFESQMNHALQFMNDHDAFVAHEVDFDSMVERPQVEVERLAEFMQKNGGSTLDRDGMIRAVDPTLRHHH